MGKHDLPRRRVLGLAATGLATGLGGCTTVLGGGGDSGGRAGPPDPELTNVTAEVQNFRQTQEYSTTFIHLTNNGGLGELRLTIQAEGTAAIYDQDEQLFSLEAGQELQTRFELFTHEGADELDIRIEATAKPNENYDTYTITEDNPDDIDFSANE